MTVAGFLRVMWRYGRPYRGAGWLILLGLLLEMSVNALVPLSFKVLVDEWDPLESTCRHASLSIL